jgi:hypothetical protein
MVKNQLFSVNKWGLIGILQTFFEKKFGFRVLRVVTLQRQVPGR